MYRGRQQHASLSGAPGRTSRAERREGRMPARPARARRSLGSPRAPRPEAPPRSEGRVCRWAAIALLGFCILTALFFHAGADQAVQFQKNILRNTANWFIYGLTVAAYIVDKKEVETEIEPSDHRISIVP